MNKLKYKVGDRVRIKSLDWYEKNKTNGVVELIDNDYRGYNFIVEMSAYCGRVMTITNVIPSDNSSYEMVEDDKEYYWTDEMIEGLVEEESIIDLTVKGEEIKERIEIAIPEGYEYAIESGKIIFTKKKKEYPKTYEECWYLLKHDPNFDKIEGYKSDILSAFQKLLICRDAYWKIAGEEMGLGKPWEPDFNNENEYKYGLFRLRNIIYKDATCINPTLLIFPTLEMRDAFYENFKEEIEQCKELL